MSMLANSLTNILDELYFTLLLDELKSPDFWAHFGEIIINVHFFVELI